MLANTTLGTAVAPTDGRDYQQWAPALGTRDIRPWPCPFSAGGRDPAPDRSLRYRSLHGESPNE